jgi:transcriptional regulator with XRE-family HTH domain
MANMKKYRKEAGFTQEKLAELCNTDPGYIRQIEIGKRFPSISYIERIAEALNVAAYRLFYDENDTSDEALLSLRLAQKDKIKTMLTENISHICSMIDDEY